MSHPSKFTKEEWVERCQSIHGDKYDYSKVDYKGSKEKVEIVCPKHGSFWQKADGHLNGSGCKFCGRRMDTEKFIERAKSVHGDRYDYSSTIFDKIYQKVTIICKVHGEFQQTATMHLLGRGCSQCNSPPKITRESFIKRAIDKHGDRYDYSLLPVTIKNNVEKVKIICKIHGPFIQGVSSHLSGRGCRVCNSKSSSRTKQKTYYSNSRIDRNNFIERSKQIHKDKYDYSEVVIINGRTKVRIICPTHGEFSQVPSEHLAGRGCGRCARNVCLGKDGFEERAREIHGDKYNYDKVIYKNRHTNVIISCPNHGDFIQMPCNHLAGNGCPDCVESVSKGVIEIENFLKENGYLYKKEYWFPDCRYKNPLRFDFAVFVKDKIFLIEFQGSQHYRPFTFGSSQPNKEENFKNLQVRDAIKVGYCVIKKIPLLCIPYYKVKSIPKILNNFLKDG